MYHLSDDGMDPRGWGHHIAEILLKNCRKWFVRCPRRLLLESTMISLSYSYDDKS